MCNTYNYYKYSERAALLKLIYIYIYTTCVYIHTCAHMYTYMYTHICPARLSVGTIFHRDPVFIIKMTAKFYCILFGHVPFLESVSVVRKMECFKLHTNFWSSVEAIPPELYGLRIRKGCFHTRDLLGKRLHDSSRVE